MYVIENDGQRRSMIGNDGILWPTKLLEEKKR